MPNKFGSLAFIPRLKYGGFTHRPRKDLAKHLSDIAWKTEVWVAESPTHIVHFNGERFLEPY